MLATVAFLAAMAGAAPPTRSVSDLDLYAAALNWTDGPIICFGVDSEGRYWSRLDQDFRVRLSDLRPTLVARYGATAVESIEGDDSSGEVDFIPDACQPADTYRDILGRGRVIRKLEGRLKSSKNAPQ